MGDLQKLQEVAIKELLDFFATGSEPEDFDRARLAQGALSNVARLKATERVSDATRFHVLRAISTNEEELREYVSVSLPHLMPVKRLKGK